MAEPEKGSGRTESAADRWRRVEAALDRVLAVDEPDRDAELAAACGDDADLQREVEQLLAAADTDTFFDHDAASFAVPALADDASADEKPPQERLGSFRLLHQIGAGGMSRVFLGEREDGDFEQRVAIKILRAVGLDLDEGASRFRAERQILATLEHRSIARVFDGGTTEAGLPYLVMELIDGEPITEHAAARGLDLDQRLELFFEVCDAVQYAHQRLIVHRDLKPSNILVTDAGELKLLDFGIAKLLDPLTLGLNAATPITRTGLLLMTPEYAAPEQIRGEEITTATDVYALGVLLYELLTGRRPFELAGASAGSVERVVCEKDPARPSTMAAAGDGEGTRRRRRRLEGDLDTIVLKALRKTPADRYDSVRALADDLGRYREGLPITARPATVGYQVRKFVGRHRWGVVSAAAVFLGLLVFGAVMTWQQGVTRRERDRAEAAEEEAAAINQFLVQGMLGAAAPEVAQGQDVSVLDAAAQRIEGAFAGRPDLEAPVRRTLGELYLRLGEHEEAKAHLDRARELFQEARGEEAPESLATERLIAELLREKADYEEATGIATRVLRGQIAALGPNHPEVWKSEGALARIEIAQGNYSGAEERLERVLTDPAAPEPRSLEGVELRSLLAKVYESQRRWVEVIEAASEVAAAQRELLGSNHPDLAETLVTLGTAQARQKMYREAKARLDEALALRERVLGPDHPETLESVRSLMVYHGRIDEYEEALRYADINLGRSRRVHSADHPWTIRAEENRAVMLSRMGRDDLAMPIYQDTARRHEEVLGIAHPSTNRSYRNLNRSLMALGRPNEARQAGHKVFESHRARVAGGDDDPTLLSDFAYHLVTIRPEDLRRPEEALTLAERAVELGKPDRWEPLYNLARVHFEMGDLERAIALQRRVITLPHGVVLRDAERVLAEYLEAAGDLETAEVEIRKNIERRREVLADDDPLFGYSYRNLGINFQKRGLLEESLAEFQHSADHFDRTLPDDNFARLRTHSELGEVLMLLGRYKEAERELLPAAEALRGRTGFRDELTRWHAQRRVADLYRAWGKPDLAAEWSARAEEERAQLSAGVRGSP